MDFIKEKSRDQIFLFCWDQMVAQDSWARVVDAFVEVLPLEELGFNLELNKEGQQPYHPSTLLKLYFYGYRKGIRSSRKLAEACKTNLELIWLLGELQPSARKIAYFRKENSKAFKAAFRYFVSLLKELNFIEGKTIAIDSFKIRAQNSLKNNFNQKKIDRHLKYIDEKIAAFENELEQNDGQLTKEVEEQIKQKIENKNQQRKKYELLEQELNATGEKQISTSDPDSKAVLFQRTSVKVGYNIQASVDQKHKLFVHNETGSVNDTHALSSMAIESKKLLAVDQLDVLSDKGYTTGKEIHDCIESDITTYSAPKAHSSQKNGLFDMQIFKYDQQNDTYTCPNNEILKTNGTIYNKNKHQVKHYKNRQACKICGLKTACTTNKSGRIIERSIYQPALEDNQKRVEQNPDYYKLRQQIIEHQFGTLKRHWGFTYTLMKGKENVLTEVNILMSCYNLSRLQSILGIQALKSLLKALKTIILNPLRLFIDCFKHLFFITTNRLVLKTSVFNGLKLFKLDLK